MLRRPRLADNQLVGALQLANVVELVRHRCAVLPRIAALTGLLKLLEYVDSRALAHLYDALSFDIACGHVFPFPMGKEGLKHEDCCRVSAIRELVSRDGQQD
jgi:hypothetical protein